MPDIGRFQAACRRRWFEPGVCTAKDGELELNAGRDAIDLPVTNLGDRPVQVGSHYHFIETNAVVEI